MKYTLDSFLPIGAFEHCGDRKIKLYGGSGGGGIPIVSDVVDTVGGWVSGASDALASVDPGPAIGDAGVAIDEGVNDAIPGGWATVGAAALAAATWGASLGATAALEAGAVATADATAAGLGFSSAAEAIAAGATTAAELGLPAATTAAELGAVAGSASAGWAGLGIEAGVAGGVDALTAEALMSGDISGLTSGAMDSALAQGTMDATTIANLSSDPIQMLNAANNWTGLATENIGTIAEELAGQGVAQSDISSYLMSQYGIDEYAAANAAGMAVAGEDAGSISNLLMTDYGPQMQGWTPAGSGGFPISGSDLKNAYNAYKIASTANKLLNPVSPISKMSSLSRGSNLTGLGSGIGSGSVGTSSSGALPGSLQATTLTSSAGAAPTMNLTQLKQLYPQLANVDPRVLSALTGKGASAPSYYNYGSEGSTSLTNTPSGGKPAAGYPSVAADTTKFSGNAPLASGSNALASAGLNAISSGALPGTQSYGLKEGGKVHRPEFITGATGHFVEGRGDGQSDDIPAMLADGEYVFDADTVASLGNGSSKAGALQLDKMRQAIRKHKRSAPHDKIPPKAKSPLEYMKGK